VPESITIHARREDLRPHHEADALLEIWPNMEEVKDVQTLPNGGTRFHWVYKMAGMRLEGESEDTEFVANQRVVSHNTGGIESTLTWNFEPKNGDTQVTVETDYHIPIPLLGKLAEALILKMNEREAETILANLKDRMEA
jgi:uncharacterized membrane protein